jgi:hypothetical protein
VDPCSCDVARRALKPDAGSGAGQTPAAPRAVFADGEKEIDRND